MRNLRALCQRCHMLHDRPHHLARRWITYRQRRALGDLFRGPYPKVLPHQVPFVLRTAGLRMSGIQFPTAMQLDRELDSQPSLPGSGTKA